MLSFAEARTRLLSDAKQLGPEAASLTDAVGRVLAADVNAPMALPRYDFSAMDGYAVSHADFSGEGPWHLPLRGESRAGQVAPALQPGCVCRIFTGAPIPAGADAVVMQEQVHSDAGVAHFEQAVKPGQHIRRAGEDLALGERALQAGSRVHAGHLALAAMLGQAQLQVAQRPRVTVLCTGDELRPAGSELQGAQIYESNSAALVALATQAGAVAHVAPPVRDDLQSLQRAIAEAVANSDLLLTVGGVSVGDHDLVRPALQAAGVSLDFWKIAIKPGKPLAVGRSERGHVLGLPGNPASALVTFALFGMPLLRAMQGDSEPLPPTLSAHPSHEMKRSPGRLEFARARLQLQGGELTATPHGNQSSGAATSLAWCNGLLVIAPELATLPAGSRVDALRFSDF